GLPIDPGIGALAGPATRRRLRRELGIDDQRLCVVVGGGAEGAGRLRPLLRAMLASQLPLHLLVLCGRNHSLLRWVRGRSWSIPLEAIPYTPDPARWLLAADVYVGKAGPSALAEAAAAGLAILVSDALPGQERSNLELLVAAGAGIAIAGPAQLLEVLGRLVAEGDPLLASLRSGAAAWARPDAAALAASQILARL
ncbi:MAG: glycosyltransferase, partial [Candidatus Dormibacteria bacterium]